MECDLFGSAVRSDTTVILQVDGSLLFESRRLHAPELAANSFAFSKQQRVQEVMRQLVSGQRGTPGHI
jgi:hypothetical protein